MIRLRGVSGPPRSSGLVGARIRPLLPSFIPLDDFMGEFIFTAEPPLGASPLGPVTLGARYARRRRSVKGVPVREKRSKPEGVNNEVDKRSE